MPFLATTVRTAAIALLLACYAHALPRAELSHTKPSPYFYPQGCQDITISVFAYAEKVIVPAWGNLTEPGSTVEKVDVIQLLTYRASYSKVYWDGGKFPGFDGEDNIHESSKQGKGGMPHFHLTRSAMATRAFLIPAKPSSPPFKARQSMPSLSNCT